MVAYFNDRFVEDKNAMLHISDLSVQRAYAVFDYFRSVKGEPLFIKDHLERFSRSAAAMRIPWLRSDEEIILLVQELLKKSSLKQAGIRLMLTGGYSQDPLGIADPNFIITCKPQVLPSISDFEKGFQIITYAHQRELPHIKTINYIMAVWLQPLLRENQADDVLYHHNNMLTEFPRSNLFILTRDGVLVTPAHHILQGVTRKKIIELADKMIRVEERNVVKEELFTAEEVFLCSTSKRIIPVVAVDRQFISNGQPGPFTRKLYEQFLALENHTVT